MRYLLFLAALALGGCYYPVYYRREARVPVPVVQTALLTRADVEKLLAVKVSDAVIIEKAKSAGVEKLSVDDIVALKQAGASDTLMQALLANERR